MQIWSELTPPSDTRRIWYYLPISLTYSSLPSQPEYIPLSKLQRYIALDQIPEELGGTFQYNHEDWIQDRMVSSKWVVSDVFWFLIKLILVIFLLVPDITVFSSLYTMQVCESCTKSWSYQQCTESRKPLNDSMYILTPSSVAGNLHKYRASFHLYVMRNHTSHRTWRVFWRTRPRRWMGWRRRGCCCFPRRTSQPVRSERPSPAPLRCTGPPWRPLTAWYTQVRVMPGWESNYPNSADIR